MSGFTKEIIAKTFTELLDEKPMSKITVKDIVERCGVNRNTFYYHFKDINRFCLAIPNLEIRNIFTTQIMEYFRKNADQFDLDEGEIRILIQYYKCLFMGFLMEWLDNNLKSDFGEEMRQASRLFEKHPELHAVLNRSE